jgi:cell pole-organizing protein PopZ
MGDEEQAPEPIEPRPVPSEDGPVTAEEIAAWCGMPTAERMASVGRRFGSMGYDEDVLRDFFQWNLQFIADAGIGPGKGAVVFQLLKEQRDESIAQELSLPDSLAGFQGRLLQASKQPAVAKTEAPAPEAPEAPEAPVDAAAADAGAEEAAPAPVPVSAEPVLPPALSVKEVKLVADYFLKSFYRHYELHQAVFGSTSREMLRSNRAPSQVRHPAAVRDGRLLTLPHHVIIVVAEHCCSPFACTQPGPRCDVRVDVPPSTVGVLPPLAVAITEAEHFAKVEAEEQAAAEAAAAAAAEAEAAAAAAEAAEMAEAAGEPVEPAQAGEPEVEEPAAAEGDAAGEEATEEAQAVEPEAADTEGAEAEQTDAGGEDSGDGPTLSELLQTAVNDQMGPVRAHMDVLIKSREATLLAKMAELEAKISG